MVTLILWNLVSTLTMPLREAVGWGLGYAYMQSSRDNAELAVNVQLLRACTRVLWNLRQAQRYYSEQALEKILSSLPINHGWASKSQTSLSMSVSYLV